MDREGMVSMEQDLARDVTTPPAAGRDRRARGQRLADLLSAAAVLVTEMDLDEPADRAGGAGPRAYPRMDKEGLDALVLDRMLGLAQELDVALPTTDDDDLTSLRVARSTQTHLIGKRRAKVVACAGPAKEELDDEGEPSQAFVSLNEGGWRKNRPGRRDDCDQRTGASSKPASSPVVCLKCGNPGHISKGCRTDPRRRRLRGVPPGLTGESGCTSHWALAFTSRIHDRH
ncbi:unnamed protein product [Lampetra fluviatilis]